MDHLQSIPRSIAESAVPTIQTFVPLLRANAAEIRSTRSETFSYGSDARQQLDVYYPHNHRQLGSSPTRTPVIIFVYGGGLVRGSKTLEGTDGLAHANIGSFFAGRYGYTTVIPDYRLMSHGARFPSGGEDVALVVEWVREKLSRTDGYQNIDLFIIGNSAGGVHLATYLLAPDFVTSKARVSTTDTEAVVSLKGVVLLSVPFNFKQALPSRFPVLEAYYGEDIESKAPQGLLKAALLLDSDNIFVNTRVMVLNGTLDPEDEILSCKTDFLNQWKELSTESFDALSVEMMEGHNHLSPPFSLGTGLEKEEMWGHQVAAFMEALRAGE